MEEQKHNYNIDSNMNHDQENVDTQMLPEEVIVTGRWTNQEHMQFVECLKKYGKDWSKLEKCVPTRTGPQVRSHAQKYFNRIKKEYQTDFPLEYIHQFTKNEPKESGESWMSADNNQCSK
ncbi:unnamed protein product [Moneuplotes crassus]|uniref:Uncharacterized protein n=1 Tax=Euplotes crassus TaxID=5936 RepID=A0AAD1UGM0_EUPCR|nr:unnamed protein product [Moneuplotes crassus]